MSTRKLLVLTGLFVGLLLFVLLYERHLPTSDEVAKAKKKLLDFKTEDVATLRVERPDLPPVSLKREASGRWSLGEPAAGPADGTTVDALVGDIGRMELVGDTQTGFDAKEFGLDAPRATASLTLKNGTKVVVRFGKDVPGTDATAVSEGSRLGVVKFAPLATLVKPLDEFRSKQLLDAPSSEVSRITVEKGAAKIVVARGEKPDKTPGEWRLEQPVKDLASQTFVEQLLSDIAAARVTEYPSISASDLARVGLQPPGAVVTLQKGNDVLTTLAFGAAKAETTGKIYARRDHVTMVVDDRVQEDLAKELSAFREPRVCPVDSWAAQRVALETSGGRVGVERVEGEWRSGGRAVSASLAEDLVDKISRAEAKRFVARKDYAAFGIPVAKGKGKPPDPLATYEVTPEKAVEPIVVKFFPASPLNGAPVLAAEVTGRTEALLVDRSVLDDMKNLAGRVRDAVAASPTAGPRRPPTPAPAPSAASSPAVKK